MKTKQELKVVANSIKNEVTPRKNTATRVGQLFLDVIDWLNSEGGGGSGGLTDDEKELFDAMSAKLFPLESSYVTKNDGVREVGTSVTPSVTLSITRRGVDVAASSTVTAAGTTIAADKKSWTAPAISSGSVTYATKVSQGGQEVTLNSLTWSFSYYRYFGEVESVPTDYAVAIKSLPGKALSTSNQLGSTSLSANKYYLFAVKGTHSFVVKHAQTGGVISGCVTGTATIAQENNQGSNSYSYVLVPKSSSSWNFTIN